MVVHGIVYSCAFFFKWDLLSEYRLYQLLKGRLLLTSMASSFLKRLVGFWHFCIPTSCSNWKEESS
jgi:hypothetical protein